MKKRILFVSIMSLLIALCSTSVANAQNGGQFMENNSIKIEQLSYSAGQAVVKITNKQNCTADEKVTGSISRIKSIPALSTDTFHITPGANLKIKAKTETNCGDTDFGNVEITINTSLPVKFYGIKVTYSSN